MNFIKKVLFASIFLITNVAFAGDYDANYYEDEGDLLFKIRGFYIYSPSKLKKKPFPIINKGKLSSIIENGYGFNTATTFFFTDNIATELSLGLSMLRIKNVALKKVNFSFENEAKTLEKKNKTYFVPLVATLQYHIALFEKVRPYIGAGYHGAYMYTGSNAIKIAAEHGAVVQVGIDLLSKDDNLFTFDIKRYFLKSKMIFKKDFLFPNNLFVSDISSKINWNPFVVSVGFGFKF